MLEKTLINISNIVWGNWLIATLLIIGVYFTFSTKFFTITHLFSILKTTVLNKNKEVKGKGTITPFQALCTALASCVGNGNIVGVATALAAGGPGAIFWMWVAGLLGMATKYAEIVLGIIYRKKLEDGTYVGGPMYYIEKGLNLKWLASIYSILMVLQISGGNLIQSNAVAGVAQNIFGITPFLSGLILCFFIGIVIIGGIKRLGKLSSTLVPFMASIYLIGGLIVIIVNRQNIIPALSSIFIEAFNFKAGVAGVGGYSIRQAMRYGVARGLYSNEAGEGSAPVIHSSAITDHPAKQGIYGITEVFIDTVVICSITALIILTSGVLQTQETPSIIVALAFGRVSVYLKYVLAISMILFAYSSILVQWYFGIVGLTYVIGEKKSYFFKYPFLIVTLIGSLSSLPIVWYLQDIILGILIIPNLIAILYLSPQVKKATREYLENRQKEREINSVS